MARILVIEDDQSMNDILVETLTDDEHDVRSAFNGVDGVELCKVVPFDLVITDVRLPGIDGVEAVSLIKTVQPKVPIVVITGYASVDTPVRSIRLKVDDYLFKPFSLKYFRGTVDRILDQENQKTKKSALIDRLFSLLGRTRSRDRKLEQLVEARQEAYRGLFVGVRSGHLNRQTSLDIYTKIEEEENAFRALLNSDNPEKEAIERVAQNFHEMLETLATLKSNPDRPTSQAQVSDVEFESLFNSMKSSEIGLDDLMYAPLLRETPDERFETLPELLELKRKLWPS